MKTYKFVVTGGTFDRLHVGHKKFLSYALSLSETVLIGLTTDRYVSEHKLAEKIQPFSVRKDALEQFLRDELATQQVRIEPIDSVFIPDVWDPLPIEAIYVSQETRAGAETINDKRIEQGKQPLGIVIFPMVLAEDALPLSSTRVRSGTINRDGQLYAEKFLFEQTLLLPDSLRTILKKPFGEISEFSHVDFSRIRMEQTITIGDITTSTFLSHGMYPKIAIVDFYVEREKKFFDFKGLGFTGKEKVFNAVSPAGRLTPSLSETLYSIFHTEESNSIVLIEGEEDLSGLIVLLFAPLDYHIFYGQPGEGLVHMIVSEELKNEALSLVKQFNRKE